MDITEIIKIESVKFASKIAKPVNILKSKMLVLNAIAENSY